MKYVTACELKEWHLEIFPVAEPWDSKHVPFRCRSWRHEGECREWKGAQDFARIREAMDSRSHWSHMVLTFRATCAEPNARVFRDCLHAWARLRKRLKRSHEDIEYIQTWEVHRSLWPHAHVAVSSELLYNCCKWKPKTNWIRLIQRHAADSGFGYVGWLEPIRSVGSMSGYLSKLYRELTGSGKEYQIPVNAPPNFRRLRASRGLLPPPLKNPDITGMLHFCSCEG